jgi:hypothetical protein
MEVAVAAVLIAVLAAATIPTLSEFLDNRDAAATAETLSELGLGINEFYKNVLTTNSSTSNTYPRFISQLTNQITSTGADVSKRNSCLGIHTSTAVTNLTAKSPFVTFNVPIGGLHTPLGVINDTLTRAGFPGHFEIHISVDSVDALRLDRIIDGGDGPNAGTLQITFSGTGTAARRADAEYWVPAAAKC